MQSQAKLLIVEDDPEIARVIRDTLVKENYKVTWASTGLEGWEDFCAATYDLVLIDLMLPEMDGFTLCKNIRWQSDVPIMIISARKEDVDKVKGLSLGADDYLAKPFSLEELKARVASLLRRWRRYKGTEALSDMITYEHCLTIDWDKEVIAIAGEEVPLTLKEFALLKLLAQNAGKTFSKNELYQHIWKQSEVGEDLQTVTVHIRSLREKLRDPVKKPNFIETIWGKGYRFIGEPL